MRELTQLVVSELHLRALFVGFGILLGFNCGLQYKQSVTPFIATIGSSGSTPLLPAAPLDEIIFIQADFLFPSRSISASFQTTPTSTTILPSPTTSTLQWYIPSQTNWDSYADLTNGISELSSAPVSKSSFSELACNSTLSDQEAVKPYFEALTRVFVAKRSLQKTPRLTEGEAGFTDLILHPSYASQEQAASFPGWNVQAHEFGLVEILVLPAVLAIVVRFTVYIIFIVMSTVANLLFSSVTLCAYSTPVCRAISVFLNLPLELTCRQGRLRVHHRKKAILHPNTAFASLRRTAVQSFLYAPQQRIRLEHVILHDENTSTPIPSSKDLYDPRYLVIVETLDSSGSGRVSIVRNFKKQDEAAADEGQLMLKTVGRRVGGYQLLQFAQELRALDRLQKSRWCHKLVASFAGPEDLHILMVCFSSFPLSCDVKFMAMIQTYYPRGDMADFISEAGGHLGRAQAKYYLVELVRLRLSIYIFIPIVLTASSLLPFALFIRWAFSTVGSPSKISSLRVVDTSSFPTSATPRSTTTPTVPLRMRVPSPPYRQTASGIIMQ